MAQNMPEGGVVPRRDIKPIFDEIEAALKGGAGGGEMPGAPMPGAAGEAKPAAGPVGGEEAMPAEGGVGVIADVLGVSMEKAQALFDAAQNMPKLAGKSAEDLAMMLEKDMNLRMQLEKNMGAGEDMMAREAMASEGMKAPMPPPMEPTPGSMKK